MEFEIKKVRVNTVVEGTIFEVKKDAVYVDIQSMYEAVIYKQHLGLKNDESCLDHYKKDDKFVAKIAKIDHEHQMILLTRSDMMRQEKRTQFDEFAKANTFEAKVTKVVKGGLLLSYKGIEMFMPGSQVDVERINLEDFQDKKLEVLVIENTPRKVVVSRRKVLERKIREAKKKELETFSVGQVIETEITTINDRGANVKLGHNYGFIHISEISHHHVKKVADFLEVGQKVTASILEIDKRGVKLSIKKLLKTPWQIFVEDHKVGDKVEGKIVRKMADAMLVEVTRDVVGIINKKDYSWNPNVNYAGEVEVDSVVELQIISMDPKKRRMSLSKKHMEYNPWSDVTVRVGESVSGPVEELQSNGALVKIQGVKAFLPIGEITDKRINAVSEALALEQVVNAVVTNVDKRSWQMTISIKQLTESKERKEYEDYLKTEEKEKKQTLGDLFADKFKDFK